MRLAGLLFADSSRYAKQVDGNGSVYALAGIPVLFSALRCLLIELNAGMYGSVPPSHTMLDKLARTDNDIWFVVNNYTVPEDLRQRLELLAQVRHEIVHPAHQPGPEANNTPRYLSVLRAAGLLQSTGRDVDYMWLDQLQSHSLFRWAFETVAGTVEILLREHQVNQLAAQGLLASYSRYRDTDSVSACDS